MRDKFREFHAYTMDKLNGTISHYTFLIVWAFFVGMFIVQKEQTLGKTLFEMNKTDWAFMGVEILLLMLVLIYPIGAVFLLKDKIMGFFE